MKQRMIALLLVLALASAVVVSAVAEEPAQESGEVTTITTVQPSDDIAGETETVQDAVTEVEAPENAEPKAAEDVPQTTGELLLFKDLEELVKKNNPTYQSLGATISAMNELEDTAGTMQQGVAYLKAQLDALDESVPEEAAQIPALKEALAEAQSQYNSLKSMIQDTTQMEAGRKQLILGAQAMYIALVGMEQQETALERQLAALDRAEEELELRADMGQVSQLQVMELKSGRASLVSGLTTLRMNISNYKMQLEQMVGRELAGNTRMGELPAVTDAELNGIDFEADLKAALRKSTDIQAANASLDQTDELATSMSGISAFWDLWDAADHTVQATKQQVEMKFRMLYAQLQDQRQILTAARTALECEELAYQAAELKYQQGTISKNVLLTAEDELKTAQEAVQTAKNNLFSTYNNYCWAVKHGILN